MKRGAATFAALVTFAAAPCARAADNEPAFRLALARGPGAASCPDAASLAKAVGRMRAAAPRSGQATPPVDIAIAIAQEGSGFVATLRASGGRSGERELRDAGPGCEGIAEALAVTLVILLDGVEPTQQKREPNRSAPEPRERASAWLDVGAAMSAGLLAKPAVVLEGDIELRSRPLGPSLALGAMAAPARSFDAGPGQVDVAIVAARVRACWRFAGPGPSTIAPCLLPALGAQRGEGAGLAPDRVATRLWAAAGIGASLELPLGSSFAGGVHADLMVPARRQSFSVDNAGRVYQSPPVAGFVGIRIAVEIW